MGAIASIASTASDGGSAWDVVARMRDTQLGRSHAAAIAAAKQALATANSEVDQDKRNHSPGCVACDQKLVDKAQLQLAQANAQAKQDQGGTDSTAPAVQASETGSSLTSPQTAGGLNIIA